MSRAQKGPHFTPAKETAKLVRSISQLLRRSRHDSYERVRRVFREVRKALGLKRPARSRHLPQLLLAAGLHRLYDAVDKAGDLQHQLLLRLLLYTALRVNEIVNIRVDDVDIDASRIYVASGKGDKDRYVLFPDHFRLALKAHLAAHPDNRYLFESRQRRAYSTRRVQQILAEYAAAADLPQKVHPHLLRHQMLTWLTAQGLSDAQIQLVSGHASKKSLEVYQHLGLSSVEADYQKAVKELIV